jgi:Zn-dependent protease
MPTSPQVRPQQRWSWTLVRVAGVEIRLHVTFLILLGWIVFSQLSRGAGLGSVLEAFGLVGMVFAIIVLHEFGHILVARRFGIRTRDILLLPIGGVARLDRMPSDPRQELLVALGGPAVNLALALVAFAVSGALGGHLGPEGLLFTGGPLLARFVWINLLLAGFNLLPAFPMDGGRALRALLSMRMDRVRATDWASGIGRAMAVAFGVIGLFGNPMLVFVALFVWIGAGEEAAMVHIHASLESMHVRDAMVTSFETLPVTATVADGIERALHSVHREFPLIQGDRLVGIVLANELVEAGSKGHGADPIGSLAHRIEGVAGPGDSVEGALERLAASETHVLPVIESNRMIGLLLPENVVALLTLRGPGVPPAHA